MKDNITEKQIIEFLKQKRISLLEELHKTDTALRALGIEEQNFSDSIEHLRINSGHPKRSHLSPLSKIQDYKTDLKLDEKIAFALTHLKYGTKKEIIDYLLQTDPELDPKKLENNLAVRLSSLLKDNQIDGNKKGRTYSYHLLR